jgi:glutamate synthase domain-containing protein 3
VDKQDHGLEKALDNVLIAKSRAAIDKGEKVQFMEVARNVNRSVGAMLSGAVTKVHPEGLPDDTLRIQLEGTGGQSFGAFLAKGITLYLIGEANDYTGKGLSGGRVVVRPSLSSVAWPRKTSSWAIPSCTVRPRVKPFLLAWPASALRCACRARLRSSKARATTAANT